MDFAESGGMTSTRLCDDSDAEFILAMLQRSDKTLNTRTADYWDCVEKIEDDIFSGKHIWYCLETNDDTIIAVARIAFSNGDDGEERTTSSGGSDIGKEESEQCDRCAVVKSIYFSSGLFSEETSLSVLQSFHVQLETTAFHMNARKIRIEVEDTQEAVHTLLCQRGYEDSSGYLLEGSTTMVLSFSKSLTSTETDNIEQVVVVESDAQNTIASLMPDLFSALHKEYNA